MVKQVLRIFQRESKNLSDAALVLGIFTLLSQLLGLVRDRLLAHYVGPGPVLDVYYAAFRLPDFLYISIASLASVTVLLPFLSARMQQGNDQSEARAFFGRVFSALSIVLVGVSILLFFIMPWLGPVLVPGFSGAEQDLLITVSRIMLLSPILMGMSNMLGAATQLFKNFTLFALSPILYNFGIIIGVLVLYPIWGGPGLALGVILGAVMHLMIQVPYLAGKHFLPTLSLRLAWRELAEVVQTSIPRTLGLAIGSLTLIVFVAMISKLGEGAISLFQFSQNLQAVPVALIGASFSVASFPILVGLFQKGNISEFLSSVSTAVRKVIFWTLPFVALFIVLRAHVVRVVYGTQALTWESTRLVAALLAIFVIGIIAQNLVLIFTRSFYAAGKTWVPLIINVLCEALKIVFALLFLNLFSQGGIFSGVFAQMLRISDVPGVELLAFPIAYVLGSWINMLIHTISFRWDFGRLDKGLMFDTGKAFLGALAAAGGSWAGLRFFDPIFMSSTFWGVLGQGLFAGTLGILAAIFVLWVLRSRDLIELWNSIHRRFWKTSVVSEPTETTPV